MNEQFQFNLSMVLAHTMLLEAKGEEPLGEAWATSAWFAGAFQDAPKVPAFRPVNTEREQARALGANVANFDDISVLAGQTNTFNQAELDRMLASAMPGYAQIKENIGSYITSTTAGEIPKDVLGQVERSAAHRSLSGGFGGSGMARNLVARDLGLTSLDIMAKGVDAGSRWLAAAKQNAVAPQFDVSSMFITPQQQIETKMFNTTGKFQRDWMKNQLDSDYSLAGRISRDSSETMSSL